MSDLNSNTSNNEEPEGERFPEPPRAPSVPAPPDVQFERARLKSHDVQASKGTRAASFALSLMYSLALLPVVGAGLGWLADMQFGTSPWGIAIGCVFGAAAGFTELVRGLQKLDEADRGQRRDKK